jgi:hypothetical protein
MKPRKPRLSKAQLEVLVAVRDNKPLCEFLTPDPRRPAFRCLGEYVPAKLNYTLDGKRIRYRTFRFLFKRNLIQPLPSDPPDGVTQFDLTERGWDCCKYLPSKGFA